MSPVKQKITYKKMLNIKDDTTDPYGITFSLSFHKLYPFPTFMFFLRNR